MKLQGTMSVKNDELYIGGVSCLELAKTYQTPLYVFDEQLARENCREYVKHFKVKEHRNRVAYAGKAFLPLHMSTHQRRRIIFRCGIWWRTIHGE